MDKATDARRRLVQAMWWRSTHSILGPAQDAPVLGDALDAILADLDDLAAVVDWPALLAAGERVGKVEHRFKVETVRMPHPTDGFTSAGSVQKMTDPYGKNFEAVVPTGDEGAGE